MYARQFVTLFSGRRKTVAQQVDALFAARTLPTWRWEAADFAANFQDSAGVTPVTALEQPVGLRLDKSKGLIRGVELVATGAGWTPGTGVTVSGNQLTVDAQFVTVVATNSGAVVSGKTYEISFNVLSVAVVGGGVSIPTATFAGMPAVTAVGSYRYIMQAAASTAIAFNKRGSGGWSGVIDSISVREIPGNHSIQPTAASRPIISAKRNMLNQADNLLVSPWVTDAMLSVTGGKLDPEGGSTAFRIIPDTSSSNNHRIRQPELTLGTIVRNYCVFIKAAGYTWVKLRNSSAFLNVNLSTGAVGGSTNASDILVTAAGNGYWKISYSTSAIVSGSAYVYPLNNVDDAGLDPTAFAGDGTSGVDVWHPQLVYGTVQGRYQRTGSRNLLLNTETPSIAVGWAAVAMVTGTVLTPNTSGAGQHYTYQTIALGGSGGAAVYQFKAKPNGYKRIMLREGTASGNSVSFDLVSKTVVGSVVYTGTIVDADDGYKLCTVFLTGLPATAVVVALVVLPDTGTTWTDGIFAGDGVSNVLVKQTQYEAGTVATAYQRVDTAANNYDAVGFPIYYAADGVDDGWYTAAAIDGTGSDKVLAAAAVTKLSDAATGTITELGPIYSGNNGTFELEVLTTGFGISVRGTAQVGVASAVMLSPATAVLAAQIDISAPLTSLDTNGAVVSNAGTLGTGNFTSQVLYSMRRNNASRPTNGRMAAEMGGFGSWSAGEIALIKQHLANLNAGAGV